MLRTRRVACFRPSVETLEDRNLLSTYTVDHLADDLVGDGLNGSLRYALTHAVDGDAITFGVTGTINLTGALPDLTHSISIEGPGPEQLTVRRDTGGNYRIFTVDSGAMVGIAGLAISNGYSDGGGGIFNSGTLTLDNATVSGNFSIFWGGGILNNDYSMATLTNCTIAGNSAGNQSGGGIANGGDVSVTLNHSTISNNSAAVGGGGIYLVQGMLMVNNCTVSNNRCDNAAGDTTAGGGIWIDALGPSTLTLNDSTVSGNRAEEGGGFFSLNFFLQLHAVNNIIAGNTAVDGPDIEASFVGSQGHNLIGNTNGGSGFDPTDLLNVNPLLGPLRDNGGPTQTMALLPGSPALNAGDPNQLGTPDQRGVVRTGGVNIGAYQASATAFVVSAPGMVQAGVPFDITVTAVDPFGQLAVGYTGTVTFSTTDADPGVVLPVDYRFQLSDAGQVTFPGGVTLITPGDQTLTVMDTADNTITGSTTVTVDNMVPGAGSHGPVQAPQPGRLPGSVPQASEPPQRQVAAVDWWFASVNKRDVGFILAQPIHHTHAEADWWALDPWWGVERVAGRMRIIRYSGAGSFYTEIHTTDAGGGLRAERFEFGRGL
jgi:hypothetical protein